MKLRHKTKPSEFDPGFGIGISKKKVRMLKADGTFNVKREGLSFFQSLSMYHSLINMKWGRFHVLVLSAYFLINCFFAFIYYYVGVENLRGVRVENDWDKFWEAFFFSAQTLTTVGYGRVSPIGMTTNIVASLESMTGLLGFALATGILYGRFSKPHAKLLYSKNALIAPYGKGTALMLRTANSRSNQLIEAEGNILLSLVIEEHGKSKRHFYQLELERSKIQFLALSWTLVHPITESSPLWGLNSERLIEADGEFLVVVKAFDDTFSQTVHAHTSFKDHEVIWGARFLPMFSNNDEYGTTLELDKISDYELVKLPEPEMDLVEA